MSRLLCLTLAAILAGAVSRADDRPQYTGEWPQWRGSDRDNVSRETGLLKDWPPGGPPLRWRVDGIGDGIASVSVAGGRVFTLGFHEGSEFAVALDQRTGGPS